jgi:regulatory protein
VKIPRKKTTSRKRTFGKPEAEAAIARYCSYQERTIGEVRRKLGAMNIESRLAEEIITRMLSEGFIDEHRYADAFMRGKFNQAKWGRLKVINSMKKKGLSGDLAEQTFNRFGKEEYRRLAASLARKKFDELKDETKIIKKHKTARFMISRGFESSLIWEMLNDGSF